MPGDAASSVVIAASAAAGQRSLSWILQQQQTTRACVEEESRLPVGGGARRTKSDVGSGLSCITASGHCFVLPLATWMPSAQRKRAVVFAVPERDEGLSLLLPSPLPQPAAHLGGGVSSSLLSSLAAGGISLRPAGAVGGLVVVHAASSTVNPILNQELLMVRGEQRPSIVFHWWWKQSPSR